MAALTFKNDDRLTDAQRTKLRAFCGELGEDIAALAEDFGVQIVGETLWPYESGFLEYAPTCGSKSGYRIVINMTHSPERQRFTIAHELAHFLLHRDNDPLSFQSETRHRSDDPFEYLEREDPAVEREANLFAASLLMPPNLFTPAFNRLGGNIELLAKLFTVSHEAARRRASELKLLPPTGRDRYAPS